MKNVELRSRMMQVAAKLKAADTCWCGMVHFQAEGDHTGPPGMPWLDIERALEFDAGQPSPRLFTVLVHSGTPGARVDLELTASWTATFLSEARAKAYAKRQEAAGWVVRLYSPVLNEETEP